MKQGDLVRFSEEGFWLPQISGKIGIVVAVRPNTFGGRKEDTEWDVFIEGVVYREFVADPEEGVLEVIND